MFEENMTFFLIELKIVDERTEHTSYLLLLSFFNNIGVFVIKNLDHRCKQRTSILNLKILTVLTILNKFSPTRNCVQRNSPKA